MPVILPRRDEDAWLDHSILGSKVLALLRPYAASDMEYYPVSVLVNNARNELPQCIERVPEPDI